MKTTTIFLITQTKNCSVSLKCQTHQFCPSRMKMFNDFINHILNSFFLLSILHIPHRSRCFMHCDSVEQNRGALCYTDLPRSFHFLKLWICSAPQFTSVFSINNIQCSFSSVVIKLLLHYSLYFQKLIYQYRVYNRYIILRKWHV